MYIVKIIYFYHKPQKIPVEKENQMSEKLTNTSHNIGFSSNDNISMNQGISRELAQPQNVSELQKTECFIL